MRHEKVDAGDGLEVRETRQNRTNDQEHRAAGADHDARSEDFAPCLHANAAPDRSSLRDSKIAMASAPIMDAAISGGMVWATMSRPRNWATVAVRLSRT